MKKRLFALAGALLLLTACSAKEAKLSEKQAQDAALKHAGFTADQVTGLRSHRDYDDGRQEYEVEFYVDGVEYDYTIDADTGDVLDFDTDGKPASAPAAPGSSIPSKPASASTATTVPAPAVTATLTKEDAEAIALEHAGLTGDQVTGLRTKYEIDDGIPEYEVDFHVGATEYDYTIHGETGDILEYEIGD